MLYITKIFLGVALLCILAQLCIPVNPVPITLQTLGILIISLIYNKDKALTIVLTYIIMGIVGIPVFANFSSGITTLTGPTGGFIFGFIICVYIICSLKRKYGEGNWRSSLIYCFVGHTIICLCGTLYLSYLLGIEKGIKHGLLPFVIPALIKVCMAVIIVQLFKKSILNMNTKHIFKDI